MAFENLNIFRILFCFHVSSLVANSLHWLPPHRVVPVWKYCVCPNINDPHCGADGQTYTNACFADCNGVKVGCPGECPCVSNKPSSPLCSALCIPFINKPPPLAPLPPECQDESGGVVEDEELDFVSQDACERWKENKRKIFALRDYCFEVCDALYHPGVSKPKLILIGK